MSRVASAGIGTPVREPHPEWIRGDLGSATGAGVRVGVVDSGWDRRLHDPRVLPGVGWVHPDPETDPFVPHRSLDDHDRIGHGTGCTDLIQAIASEVEIVPIRVFGTGLETSIPILVEALEWASQQGLDVVNVSLGAMDSEDGEGVYRACERLLAAGTLVVAAVVPQVRRSVPGSFEHVIGVADAPFGSRYEYIYRPAASADCLAKGMYEDVLLGLDHRAAVTGSSFAAPSVTGMVALLRQRHPGSTLEEMRELLSRYARPAVP